MLNQHLLIIDPQVDFCEPSGSLYVANNKSNAVEDMTRLGQFIDRVGDRLADIHVTMDSHRRTDIAHPLWWKDRNGQKPGPFTMITSKDVENGTWTPAIPQMRQRSLDYVRALEKGGKFVLIVWPEHCLIGTPGHNVTKPIADALHNYEGQVGRMVNYVTKGSNPFTEHYSVFRAEVPDPADPSTQLNAALVQTLQEADLIYVGGEAQSHCVASSIRDLASAFGDDSYLSKMTLLIDCMSNVGDPPGTTMFTDQGNKFVAEMQARGMKVAKSTDVLK
jgi:nicotinamidase-related amidase